MFAQRGHEPDEGKGRPCYYEQRSASRAVMFELPHCVAFHTQSLLIVRHLDSDGALTQTKAFAEPAAIDEHELLVAREQRLELVESLVTVGPAESIPPALGIYRNACLPDVRIENLA